MDAEIWSYADTRNGRLILRALTAVILIKELAVLVLPVFGLPAIDPVWTLSPAGGLLDPLRGPLTVAIKLLLLLCLYGGFTWARIGLGLVFLLTSLHAALVVLAAPLEGLGPILTIANAGLGLLLALILLLSAQLRAYLWRKAATRLIIPIPGDDEPVERAKRSHTIGQRIVIVIQRLVSLVILAALLTAIAHLYGFTGPVLRAFGL